jgi:hypothetical protein
VNGARYLRKTECLLLCPDSAAREKEKEKQAAVNVGAGKVEETLDTRARVVATPEKAETRQGFPVVRRALRG